MVAGRRCSCSRALGWPSQVIGHTFPTKAAVWQRKNGCSTQKRRGRPRCRAPRPRNERTGEFKGSPRLKSHFYCCSTNNGLVSRKLLIWNAKPPTVLTFHCDPFRPVACSAYRSQLSREIRWRASHGCFPVLIWRPREGGRLCRRTIEARLRRSLSSCGGIAHVQASSAATGERATGAARFAHIWCVLLCTLCSVSRVG